MYLGLDLRGGVHFLMQVDMNAALTKKADATAGDVRTLLRDKNIRHTGITRDGNGVVVRFRDQATLAAARNVLQDQLTDFNWVESQDGADWKLAGTLKPDATKRVQTAAITQNITTLHNRVNELGVAEPVIQQQGADRVVVAAAGRAGHRQGEGHHRPHRDARDAHGRRQQRGARWPRAAPARCRSATSATRSAAASRSWSSARCSSPARTSPTRSPASTARARSRRCT